MYRDYIVSCWFVVVVLPNEVLQGMMCLLVSAQQHTCCSALYAIARLSVRLSHGWISQKLFKLGSCNFHQRVARWLVSSWLTSPWNSKGNMGSGGTKWGG